MNWWIIPMIVVQLGDIVTTLLAGFENEGNPVMAYVGPVGMVIGKALGCLVFYLMGIIVHRFPEREKRIIVPFFNIQMGCAILVFLGASVWNLYWTYM